MSYCEENNIPHITFNNLECVFRKGSVFSCLTFCGSDKNKKMLDNYAKVIDGIKEELLSFTDEFEDGIFIVGKDFMRFRFKTNECAIIKKLMFQSV